MSIYTYNSHESMVPVHYRPMIASNHPSASRGKHPLRQVITADSQASFQTSSISPAPDVEDEAWHMLMARVERMKHAIATADSESDHLRSGTVTPSVVASRRPDIYGASSPNFANQSRPIDYRRPSATSQLPDYHCDVSETARRLQEFQFGPSPMATAAAVNTTNIATNPITPPKSMSGTHKPSGSLSGHSIRSAANSTRHMRNDSSKSSIYSSYKQPAILYSSYNGDDNNDNDDAGMESSLYYPPGRAQRRQSQYAIVPPSASSRALPRALPASSKHRMMRDRHGRLVLPPSSSHSRRVSSSSRRQLSISTITHTRNNSHYRLLRTLPLEVLRQVAEYLAADPSSTIVAFACVSRACYAAAVSDGGLRERVYRGRYLLHGSAGAGAGEVESDFLRWELRRMYGDQSNMLALNQTSPALTDKSNIYNVAGKLTTITTTIDDNNNTNNNTIIAHSLV
ncbi:hypothetical protein BDF22DRAFT_50336 [Syncephalis plumigaleata]|nr:hypothetical protein BDF22DRAFT_50336 [Syncephalis plumigaleata]